METMPGANELPITVDPQMVNLIRQGLKTEIRKIIRFQPPQGFNECVLTEDFRIRWRNPDTGEFYPQERGVRYRYGHTGHRLWVQEPFFPWPGGHDATYMADWVDPGGLAWKPAMLMPRHLSRIILQTVSVHPEKLSSIQDDSAAREIGGNLARPSESDRLIFFEKWHQVHGNHALAHDPWVWAIRFKPICM